MMNKYINIDKTYLNGYVSEKELTKKFKCTSKAFETLVNGNGLGNDFIGWRKSSDYITDELVDDILTTAEKIKKESEVLVVIGIGGSFLGAQAVVNALHPYYKDDMELMFVGNNLSSEFLHDSLEYIRKKDFSICVISKSGTTTESSIAFRLFKNLLKEKYKKYFDRIYAVTDKASGALRTESNNEGYKTFDLPANIGGRFSVFTPVGLLPLACGGVDIKELIAGLKEGESLLQDNSLNNPAILYATIRNVLYDKKKSVESLVFYEPKMSYIAEWWKQLFGESEGKENKGLMPVSMIYSRDLHSLGQYIQDGKRIMFETIVRFNEVSSDLEIPLDEDNLDNLNYLAGKKVSYINNQALIGTAAAHFDGGCPSIIINVDKISGRNIAYLLYFFMVACGVSGYTLGVNPFNQPGVEAYKRNMFKLLKKPGYENN